MNDKLREGGGLLIALLISIAAAILLTWPMVLHLNEAVMGAGELGGWLWRYDWHFRSLEAVSEADMGLLAHWRAFVSLGRYPETGNIMDVLALSYPLQLFFGFPAGYNLKIFLILSLNGLCAYALGRYFSGSISAAIGASVIAVANPLCLMEIQACGLRQAILWWILLYPPLLDQALRRRTISSALLAGLCLALVGAFYWFYGLFSFIFTIIWIIKHLITERGRLDRLGTSRAIVGLGLGTILAVTPFILPYALPEKDPSVANKTAATALPEMSFFLPFPSYDTISHAPLRPSTYAENVHASLHRTIGSSWSASYPLDPTLNEALPLTVFLFGLLSAPIRRRSWGWLAIWIAFYLGTLGPFLRIGQGDSENVTKLFDEYVIRLPYTWMFQFVPGMSRMFAPYRLGSYVIVASVALVAMGLSRFRWRAWIVPVVIVGTVVQPMLRLGRGAINEMDTDLREFRSPLKMNRIEIPDFYKTELDPKTLGGLVELPLEQQQDIVCYYQTLHQQKVYKSWATPGSIPPSLRLKESGGWQGELLRFQALPDTIHGPIPDLWQQLSLTPDTADASVLATAALNEWAQSGKYKWVILHERGYLLVEPSRGFYLYEAAKNALKQVLGEPVESKEATRSDPANAPFGAPLAGELIPWSSQPLRLPREGMPDVYRMAVFRLPVTLEELQP